jgi:hypothetical protein
MHTITSECMMPRCRKLSNKAEQKLILITDFIEQKLRKEQELEFYIKELNELNRKIGFLRAEVDLTNTIIDMIKREQVYDVEENMIENNSDKLIGPARDAK